MTAASDWGKSLVPRESGRRCSVVLEFTPLAFTIRCLYSLMNPFMLKLAGVNFFSFVCLQPQILCKRVAYYFAVNN